MANFIFKSNEILTLDDRLIKIEKKIKEKICSFIEELNKKHETKELLNSISITETKEAAKKIFQEFKKNIPIYNEIKKLKDYKLNDLDILMTAQHYGTKTRLIDWTQSPLVALYFATEKKKEKKGRMCICICVTRNAK